ncbi:MAG: cupredoxin domain-containing protein [Nitrospirota bacterium]|nr:cupredoxin domain-containing protein [Nitrospirota bacterium]
MRTVNFWNQHGKLLRVGAFFCLLGIVCFSGSKQPLLWASSPHIQIQPEPPFFSPNQLTISLNTPLRWENRTHEAHSIVSDDCQSRSECSFDSGIIRPDNQFVLSRLAPGRYPYHCGLHPFMRGLLTIHPPQPLSSDI